MRMFVCGCDENKTNRTQYLPVEVIFLIIKVVISHEVIVVVVEEQGTRDQRRERLKKLKKLKDEGKERKKREKLHRIYTK